MDPTTSTLELLTDLRSKGVKLWVDGAELRLSAPQGVLTPDLVATLRARKPELLVVLRQSAGAGAAAPGPRRTPRTGPAPASFGQQQLWLLDQLGHGAAYTMSLAQGLTGPLDEPALQRALDELVRRHDSLRTTFHQSAAGELHQTVEPPRPAELMTVDLRSHGAGAPAEADARIDAALARPFDLAADPLLRALLLRTGESTRVLLLALHHIASDGWSMSVLTRELSALYTAFASGAAPTLPELPIQYADFATWQRERLTGDGRERLLKFWRERLTGAPTQLRLPADEPAPRDQSGPLRGARLDFTIDAATTRALRTLARDSGATLFITLLAAFQVLLARHSGQHDLLVGTPAANRTHAATEPLIGYFVNTLVLRAQLGDDPTFRDHLARTRDATHQAYDHQELPFEQLVEALAPERALRHNPLVQALFALQNAADVLLTLPGVTATPIDLATRTARMDLEIDVIDHGDTLTCAWVHDSDRFTPTTMQRMADGFRTLLAEVAADPSRRLSSLPVIGPDERRRLLVDWNATAAPLPSEGCVHRMFAAQAARTPDALALIHAGPHGVAHLTYRALDEQSNRLAHRLVALGVGPDTLVGLHLGRSLDQVVGMLGILKAGGAYVPLDPSLPKDRLGFLLRDARPQVVVTHSRAAADLPPHEGRLVRVDVDLAECPATPKAVPVGPQHLAYVLYTSGSTGQPKGVQIEHGALLAHAAAYVEFHGLTPADRILALAEFHFDASVEQIFPALIAGTCVVLPEWDLDPHRFTAKLIEFGLTIADTSGAHWRGLVDAWSSDPTSASGLRMRSLIIGGDVMPAAVLPRWQATPLASRCRLFNVYGPTETTVAATIHEIGPDFDAARTRIPIGRPLANRTVHVLDVHGALAPVGVPGELYIGGVGVARGYLRRPDLTAEKFVRPDTLPFAAELDPRARAGRLYRTGDLCRWLADGTLDFLGRIDEQVKIRGYRVELGEIEAQLLRQPGVRDAVVVVDATGLHRQLVAYVVPSAEASTEDDLVAALHCALRAVLPEYMLPSRTLFLPQIPRITASGKVDRAALPRPAPAGTASFTAPRTATEQTLAGVWCEVLGRPRVGIHDNFFELGGHSLLATQVVSRVNHAFAINLPLQSAFESPTVAEMAIAVDRAVLAQGLLAREAPRTGAEQGDLGA